MTELIADIICAAFDLAAEGARIVWEGVFGTKKDRR